LISRLWSREKFRGLCDCRSATCGTSTATEVVASRKRGSEATQIPVAGHTVRRAPGDDTIVVAQGVQPSSNRSQTLGGRERRRSCRGARSQPLGLLFTMTLTLRGHIENGNILVDEGVALPEGTEVRLSLVEDADDLDDEDRARLHEALDLAQAEIDRGEAVPASDVITEPRKHGR
jgi:hypothetical protein